MLEREELREEIGTAIMQLSESYRIVIALRYQMEFTNQEIADILGVSKDNVEVKVHRARMALRKEYWIIARKGGKYRWIARVWID